MHELQHTVTFRCGHKEAGTVKFDKGGIRSRWKIWMRSTNETSPFLCKQCMESSPRHAPPARGVSQTIAAIALGCQGHSVRALREVQIRWGEVATLSRLEHIEEFSADHQNLAAEAERALIRIDAFWRSRHAEHIIGVSSSILSSSERGPDACPLCREYLNSAIEDVNDAGEDYEDRSHEHLEPPNGRVIEERLSRNGLDIRLHSASPQSSNPYHRTTNDSIPPGRRSRRHTRRSRFQLPDLVRTPLSTILEEMRTRGSSELSISIGSPSLRPGRPGLWSNFTISTRNRSLSDESPRGLQGLWQDHQEQSCSSRMRPFIVEEDCTRPPRRKPDESLNVAKFRASDNSLWQAPKSVHPPKINPDSVEGYAKLQRIRNHLGFPGATPLELLSIRRLPDSFTDVDDLLEYSEDMLEVAWKQEDEDSSKIIRATRPCPDSFDGKQTLVKIKRILELPGSANISYTLSIPKLPAGLTKEDIETLVTELDFVFWGDRYEPQVKNLRAMALERLKFL